MKRFVGILLAIAIVFGTQAFTVCADVELELIINGTDAADALYTQEINGEKHLMAPVASFCNYLDAHNSYKWSDNRITVTKDETTIVFTPNEKIATVNGKEILLSAPAQVKLFTAYVPVEFTADKLGYRVLRERGGNRVRVVSYTGLTAPAVSTDIKPGMAELYSDVHRLDGVNMEFKKSNELTDGNLIFCKEDYSDVAESIIAPRGGECPTGEMIFTSQEFMEEMDNYDADTWITTEKVDARGKSGRITMNVKMAGNQLGIADNYNLPFTDAVRINVLRVTDRAGDFPIVFKRTLPPPERNDKYVLSFYARLISGGDPDYGTGSVCVQVQSPAPDWFKTVDATAEFGTKWQRFDYLLTGYADAKTIRVLPAFQKQVIEMAGFEIYDIGEDADVSYFDKKEELLPQELAPGASWRVEALERIEKIRKGDFKVVVKDKNGNPVPDVVVNFDMFEHEFKFGVQQDIESVEDVYWEGYVEHNTSGVLTSFSNGNRESDFRRIRGPLFNALSVGNRLKWGHYAQNKMYNPDLPPTARVVIDKANEDGIKYTRGHALWMPSNATTEYPQELYDLLTDPHSPACTGDAKTICLQERYDKFLELVENHFAEMNEKFPEIYEWDVTNETHGRTYFTNTFGTKVFNDIYRIAAEQLTNGQSLMLCDNRQFEAQYWERLDWFKEQGIEYDALGMQGHSRLGSNDPNNNYRPTKWLEVWDRFAYEYGKTFAVTEFSVGALKDEYGWAGQADYMRDIMIAAFSHPACTGFNMWWMADYWIEWNSPFNPVNQLNKGNGAGVSPLYGNSFEEKPGVEVYKDLLYNKWWTKDAKATTNENGEITINGYYGDYDVTVNMNGEQKTVMAAFHKGYENVLTITLD